MIETIVLLFVFHADHGRFTWVHSRFVLIRIFKLGYSRDTLSKVLPSIGPALNPA